MKSSFECPRGNPDKSPGEITKIILPKKTSGGIVGEICERIIEGIAGGNKRKIHVENVEEIHVGIPEGKKSVVESQEKLRKYTK